MEKDKGEERMREIAVAIQNDNQNVTPIETMDAIKKAGFKNVFIQWYNKNWQCSQQEQLDYARKLGLNVIFAHLGYQDINEIWKENKIGESLVARYKNDLKLCKENHISLVIMHLISKNLEPMYNEIGLHRIKQIVDYAKKLDIKVTFENTKTWGYLEYVLTNLDNDNIGVCYDAGHCHAFYHDEFSYDLFKNRIFAVHLHDNDKSDDLHLMPFDGTIDWKHVISKLQESNYEGPITLELCYRYDYLKMSIDEFYQKGFEVGEKLARMFGE